MKTKLFILLILSFVAAHPASAQSIGKRGKKPVRAKKVVSKPQSSNVKPTAQTTKMKILVSDAQSAVETTFVFAARDAETYARLQKIVPQLPQPSSINFQTTAIVAAFAGTKPTGGYEVVFEHTANNLKINLTAPPRDAMSAQVLTQPVSVVAVAIEENQSLMLDLAANWLNAASVYRIVNGKFEASGGFAGTSEKFGLSGTVKILRANDLATAIFDLRAVGKTTKMFDAASGFVENGKINIARIDAGTLVASPRPPLAANGEISDTKLNLTFEPLPTNTADGFEGRGTLEAKP